MQSKQKKKYLLWLIISITLISIIIDLPQQLSLKIPFTNIKIDQTISRPELKIKLGPINFFRDLEIRQGLDLQGGTHLVLEANMNDIKLESRQNAIDSAKNIVERRVNLFGVTEPTIQTSRLKDSHRIIVELPGVKNTSEAIDLIGKTAQLDFRELPQDASPSADLVTSLSQFTKTGLTGKDLKNSQVKFDPNTGQPQVGLEFTQEGAKKFSDITQRNVGKIVGIFLDDIPITLPKVNEAITSGEAVITGNFTIDEAKKLSIQLNAGALPVPLKVIEQRNVGATLGQESVQKSIRAGLIGLLMVIGFMWTYYGRLGFLADIALLIYGLITLALYKLIPITLTLPGIAGFILSVGMAVDANILIFERMKEELREGKPWQAAMELGFGRAWDSIKDANVCTLITCFVLFNPFNWTFLNASGMIRGFALTLGLGIGISLFTGIVVTRTLLRVFYHQKQPASQS